MKFKNIIILSILGLTAHSTQAMFKTAVRNFSQIVKKTNIIKSARQKLIDKLEDFNELVKIAKPLVYTSVFDIAAVYYIKDSYDQAQMVNCQSEQELKEKHHAIYKRYNAPRYTESKVSSKDVDLGGLINPW